MGGPQRGGGRQGQGNNIRNTPSSSSSYGTHRGGGGQGLGGGGGASNFGRGGSLGGVGRAGSFGGGRGELGGNNTFRGGAGMALGGGQLYPPQSGITISNRGNNRVSFEGMGSPPPQQHHQQYPQKNAPSHSTLRSGSRDRDRDRDARVAADRELAAFEALGLVDGGGGQGRSALGSVIDPSYIQVKMTDHVPF